MRPLHTDGNALFPSLQTLSLSDYFFETGDGPVPWIAHEPRGYTFLRDALQWRVEQRLRLPKLTLTNLYRARVEYIDVLRRNVGELIWDDVISTDDFVFDDMISPEHSETWA